MPLQHARFRSALVLLLLFSTSLLAGISQAPPVVVQGLGRGTVTLSGPWQFHLGDDPAWSAPTFNDSTWPEIHVDRVPGDQGYPTYQGYAWYRRAIDFRSAPAETTVLYLPPEDGIYQTFWNGRLIGESPHLPGTPFRSNAAAQAIPLVNPGAGVLAIRFWAPPFDSSSRDDSRGMIAAPVAGNPEEIAGLQSETVAASSKASKLNVAEFWIYLEVVVFGLIAWLRNRNQPALLWITLFLTGAAADILLDPDTFPALHPTPPDVIWPMKSLQDAALWFLLLYLFALDKRPVLLLWTRILAVLAITASALDNFLFNLQWSSLHVHPFQVLDAVLTFLFSAPELFPFYLIYLSRKQRLDRSRVAVAYSVLLLDLFDVIQHTADQGRRFTHATLGNVMSTPLLHISGAPVDARASLSILLVLALAYALYRQSADDRDRQRLVLQEFKSAQELQRVLVPDKLPPVPGFALTSAYQPAQQVGGDFFQVIPTPDNSTLILLGDVSGKGLKAAMTVALIVGAVRTLAETSTDPAVLLAGLNRRLYGRLQFGFATCLVLHLQPDGNCSFANAGHLLPFLNATELDLPPALPLGLDPDADYQLTSLHLDINAQLTLYTDGLLEARNHATGELFGFDRVRDLLSVCPSAAQAVGAAIEFGQDDDITVLTLTRLATGITSTATLSAPALA